MLFFHVGNYLMTYLFLTVIGPVIAAVVIGLVVAGAHLHSQAREAARAEGLSITSAEDTPADADEAGERDHASAAPRRGSE